MNEKRGNTEKLIYPFNTSGVLEVYLPGLKGWYRTTAKDFRSFDGRRRITEPIEIQHKNVYVETKTCEYDGPVFLFGTNKEVVSLNEGKIITSPVWDQTLKMSGSRK